MFEEAAEGRKVDTVLYLENTGNKGSLQVHSGSVYIFLPLLSLAVKAHTCTHTRLFNASRYVVFQRETAVEFLHAKFNSGTFQYKDDVIAFHRLNPESGCVVAPAAPEADRKRARSASPDNPGKSGLYFPSVHPFVRPQIYNGLLCKTADTFGILFYIYRTCIYIVLN